MPRPRIHPDTQELIQQADQQLSQLNQETINNLEDMGCRIEEQKHGVSDLTHQKDSVIQTALIVLIDQLSARQAQQLKGDN